MWDQNGYHPLVEAIFAIATDHLRAARRKQVRRIYIECIQYPPFHTRTSNRDSTNPYLRYCRLPHLHLHQPLPNALVDQVEVIELSRSGVQSGMFGPAITSRIGCGASSSSLPCV